ncbi:hypothetical protein P152DRAFT_393442 [Eremomyces bilateralis CBS 781.70]|uniref:DUF3431 domain-containing protein n=1 Tax=Eremomyces bilateralis CBS 781.70 TaxID=1392243 RepID=A0A6G1G9U4_9PEZI|nr:uncharacterized protein P152DRAFT_393442 [Eremomyces bilateralis CBS 781.70]KAF1814680.1 hypothetical protein P152DRAFT_393442 [Eremomyces bilateralis CBS 781.70]
MLSGTRFSGIVSHSKPPSREKEYAFVVASRSHENTTWLNHYFPEWAEYVYVVDDPNAALTVSVNKGRESMVYLSFIIDNYENLPELTIFHHALRYQWHNDDPIYDGVAVLRQLQIDYLLSAGYTNLRCVWVIGCPGEFHPLDDEKTLGTTAEISTGQVYANAFRELFPGEEVPELVGVSCCAQFSATREKIRERPKSDYVRYLDWVNSTDLEDYQSGRVLEYSWHMIFGKPPVHCPDAETCYCELFGLCNITCDSPSSCEGRYTLPPFSTIPEGWPEIGWNGEDTNVSSLYG